MADPQLIGVLYSLFTSDDGEVFSGGGEWDPDTFAEFIGKEVETSIKQHLKKNANRTFSLVINSENIK